MEAIPGFFGDWETTASLLGLGTMATILSGFTHCFVEVRYFRFTAIPSVPSLRNAYLRPEHHSTARRLLDQPVIFQRDHETATRYGTLKGG